MELLIFIFMNIDQTQLMLYYLSRVPWLWTFENIKPLCSLWTKTLITRLHCNWTCETYTVWNKQKSRLIVSFVTSHHLTACKGFQFTVAVPWLFLLFLISPLYLFCRWCLKQFCWFISRTTSNSKQQSSSAFHYSFHS